MHATANLSVKLNIREYQSIIKVYWNGVQKLDMGGPGPCLDSRYPAEVNINRDCCVFHLQWRAAHIQS